MNRNIVFTKDGFKKILKQKEELEKRREEVLVRLTRAREMGDLSENSAYHGAKMEIGDIDRRLRQIKIYLKFGKIAEPANPDVIAVGSQVLINNGAHDLEINLVGQFEADPAQGKISLISPLGSQLLGKRKGDKIELDVSSGKVTYVIKSVKT